MNENKNKQRNSSIELLRILSMFMIVACHFATHGGFSFEPMTLSIPRFWWNIIEMGGNLGVDVFVLISGYFLVKSTGSIFNIKRILRFWGQIIFYSISIYLVFGMLGISKIGDIPSLIKTFLPITFGSWWFASTYFVLYLIHPFINMLLQKMDKAMYQKYLVLTLTLWCIIPTFTTASFEGNSLLWFVTLYSVSGYVRIYGLNANINRQHYLAMFLLFSALRYFSCVVLILIGTKISFVANHTLFFYGQRSVLTFISALSLFMFFEKTHIDYSKAINTIASASFGVYLIHDSNIIRPYLWHVVFKNAQYQESISIIPYSIVVVIVVYSICTVIDLLRQRVFEKPFMIIVNKYSERFFSPLAKLINTCKLTMFGKENEN